MLRRTTTAISVILATGVATVQGMDYKPYYDAVAARDPKAIRAAATLCGALPDRSAGVFALETAVRTGRWDLVAPFLSAGTKPDVRNREDESTPLMWAAQGGHIEIVHNLVHAGAGLNATDRFGRTPLFYAATSQDIGIVGLLLKSGANPRHLDVQGRSAADVARYRRIQLGRLGISGRYRTFVDTEVRRMLRRATAADPR